MRRGLVKRDNSSRADYTSEFKPFRYSVRVNPFLEVAELEEQLARIFQSLHGVNPPSSEAFYRSIRNITSQLLGIAEQAPDALLGTVHWPSTDKVPYSVFHPIRCAILVALVALHLKVKGEKLFSIMAAALTANLGMLTLQDKLNQQKTPLTAEQKIALQEHPDKSVLLLESLGVTDPVWLRAVLHHHERLDGSGYPQGLQGNEITNEAKLIALTDIYIALISAHEYREALSAKGAIRKLLIERGNLVGEELTKIFLSQLGIYPPGIPVKLKNGDLAVVTKRGEELNKPIAAGIRAASGQVYMHPPPRDTSLEEFEIIELVSHELLKPLQPFLFWDVHTRKAIEL